MLENSLYIVEHKDVTNKGVVFSIRQNKGNEIFKAHFPGFPITPGACLVEIAKELCERHLQKPLRVTFVKSVKFISIITPAANEFLQYSIAVADEDGGKCSAKIQILSEGNVCSKIHFVLE